MAAHGRRRPSGRRKPATPAELRDAIRDRGACGWASTPSALRRPSLDARGAARSGWSGWRRSSTRGFQGDMGWLGERTEERVDPTTLWPEARTVVSLALNYGPRPIRSRCSSSASARAISVYAQGRDYHEVMKTKLKALGRFIWDTYRHDLKVFVDTAPLMEKPAAQAAGHGWQGKHTNLVSRRFGSWLFLGELLLSVELPSDAPETDHCGQCRACLDVCPTNAFPAPYQLDARRCISYLTIEHEGPIDRELRPLLGNRIYGCDDCLAVCPWNKFAQDGARDRASRRAPRSPRRRSPSWRRSTTRPSASASPAPPSSASAATASSATSPMRWATAAPRDCPAGVRSAADGPVAAGARCRRWAHARLTGSP